MQTGDYVLIARGTDDVFDGQLCKIMSPDEAFRDHVYKHGDQVPVLCWTGYMAWTNSNNLIPVTCNGQQVESLFERGMSRTGTGTISF